MHMGTSRHSIGALDPRLPARSLETRISLCPRYAWVSVLDGTPRAAVHLQSLGCKPHILFAGTMLFGESTPAREAAALLEQAAETGVNFIDCAEMYPVPQRAETQGRSEAIIGQWLAGKRRQALLQAPHATHLQCSCNTMRC